MPQVLLISQDLHSTASICCALKVLMPESETHASLRNTDAATCNAKPVLPPRPRLPGHTDQG